MRSGPRGDVRPIVEDTRHERVRSFYSTAVLFVERDERSSSQKGNIFEHFFFYSNRTNTRVMMDIQEKSDRVERPNAHVYSM